MITYAGMSHHTAPVDVREQLSMDGDVLPDVLRRAQDTFGAGAAIVGTCNRLELYLGGHHEPGPILGFLRREIDVDADTVERYFHVAHGTEAVRHLYRVSSGLDSMVLGETEILGQVRTAFATTVQSGTDNHVISRLFHTAIRTGRKARAQTGISVGALSVSSIAAQRARALFPDFASARVLVVGAGEAGRLAAEALAAQGPGELIVTNRTPGRAEQLAHSLGGITVPFEDLHDAIRGADVVVGATGAPDPLVTTEDVARITESRAGRPLLIVDIGVPRDFPGAVQHLDGVEYHDLDALQSVTGRNNEARRSEIEAVESLIDIEVTNFQEWWDQLQIVPTITALRDRADALRRGEVAKTLRRLRVDPEDREQVEQLIDVLSRSIVNQVLADPIAVLRERGDRDTYVDATRTLFRLHDRHDG